MKAQGKRISLTVDSDTYKFLKHISIKKKIKISTLCLQLIKKTIKSEKIQIRKTTINKLTKDIKGILDEEVRRITQRNKRGL